MHWATRGPGYLDTKKGATMRNRRGEIQERRVLPRTNQMLAARVCAEIDHNVAHGRAIQVFAEGDHVTLRGVALSDELHDVLRTACSVRGVGVVSNQLETRDSPGKVFALQA